MDDRTAAEGFCRLLDGAEQPLLVAYNAQFDLNFLYYLLRPLGLLSVLQKPRFLDALTVYRDRRDFPHKLCNAIEAYGLTGVENSHRAVDDARAAALLLEAMAAKRMICCNMWISPRPPCPTRAGGGEGLPPPPRPPPPAVTPV